MGDLDLVVNLGQIRAGINLHRATVIFSFLFHVTALPFLENKEYAQLFFFIYLLLALIRKFTYKELSGRQ